MPPSRPGEAGLLGLPDERFRIVTPERQARFGGEAAPAAIPLVPREVQGIAQDVAGGFGGLPGGRRR